MPVGPSVSVSEIGEFVRHRSCERRFRLSFNNRHLAKRLPFSERLFNTIDPVLKETGRQREDDWENSLLAAGFRPLGGHSDALAWSEFSAAAAELEPDRAAFAREVEVSGQIGAFHVRGRIDFVLLLPAELGHRIRLVECKASRKDRTYHRIQLALYELLVAQLVPEEGLTIAGLPQSTEQLETVIARLDEATNAPQSLVDLEPLLLDIEKEDARRLLVSGGPLEQITQTSLDELEYQLGPGCDGCVFNVDCFPETARLRRLQLLGLDPPAVRLLESNGIETIDELVELDLDGPSAKSLAARPELPTSVANLIDRAKARQTTLPGSKAADAYEVMPFGGTQSQLPSHLQDSERLVRVYLSVSYDYVENRIGALAAHVTASSAELATDVVRGQDGNVQRDADGNPVMDPVVKERDSSDRLRPLEGEEVIQIRRTPWSGDYVEDNGGEKQLIQNFLMELIEAITSVAAPREEAPVHFYVWSRSEMTQLTEACSRVGSELLASLHELLGCRGGLEQVIYSSLQDEVDGRFALGWTGRALTVATSLWWFGKKYHWTRIVNGKPCELDRELTQDLFDFKTTLHLGDDAEWTTDEDAPSHTFEIRSRWFDSLTAPYWRALWGTLPDPSKVNDARLAASIRRYNRASSPGVLKAYFVARTQAMRWIDERVAYKNTDLPKPRMRLSELSKFSLGVDTTRRAALNFLRLDQHVGMTDWISRGCRDMQSRVADGRTVPLFDVRVGSSKDVLEASINLADYGLVPDEAGERSSFSEGSFVRVSPTSNDPRRGQTLGQLTRIGATCVVARIDWQAASIELNVIFARDSDDYVLRSFAHKEPGEQMFDFAAMDESPSDYVARRVDSQLRSVSAAPAFDWFHTTNPVIPPTVPPSASMLSDYQALVSDFQAPEGYGLNEGQITSCLEGLNTRVQLLLGPPGTGKTETTALSVLLRVLNRCLEGDVVLLGANTHTAINELLSRIAEVLPSFVHVADDLDLDTPSVEILKIEGRDEDALPDSVHSFPAKSSVTKINKLRKDSTLIIGGTTSALIKLSDELSDKASFTTHDERGIQTQLLVVDEASMMVFPHFLALATMVAHDGDIMLAGDHRQLAPIVSHDWDNEDRPPVQLYKPFVSAYEAVQRVVSQENVTDFQGRQSRLTFTHRLPPDVRRLIGTLYEHLDDVVLEGRERANAPAITEAYATLWERVMLGPNGLYLLIHDERASSNSNSTEATIVAALLDARVQAPDSVAVVTPHRAQRALLRNRLKSHDTSIRVVDTVEKVQGTGVETVIVSACGSDPSVILTRAEFILDLNRANVAFSRSKRRLIVVVARTLINALPPEYEQYQSAMLWKALRQICRNGLGTTKNGEAEVCGWTA